MENERQAVISAVEEAYVAGVQNKADLALARKGFAAEFQMLTYSNDAVDNKITVEALVERVKKAKAENPGLVTTHKILLADVVGNAGFVKIELHRNGVYFFTDYLLLYKFSDGWKIVAKTYTKDPAFAQD